MDIWYELGSLVPSICVGLLFWFVMRAILRADRREREAERAAEKETSLTEAKERARRFARMQPDAEQKAGSSHGE